ncbi:MAG: Type 1 glutamine amidotransferase-like domain-containing protein [Microthrixaceae bacterium]
MTIGVLALQGAFAAHQRMLEGLGASPIEVRQPKHLDGVDALVIPGGESTTMSKLAVSTGLFQPISERLAAGMPAFGTCAGAIMLATHIARRARRPARLRDTRHRRAAQRVRPPDRFVRNRDRRRRPRCAVPRRVHPGADHRAHG